MSSLPHRYLVQFPCGALGAAGLMTGSGAMGDDLVGRDRELAVLTSCLHEAGRDVHNWWSAGASRALGRPG